MYLYLHNFNIYIYTFFFSFFKNLYIHKVKVLLYDVNRIFYIALNLYDKYLIKDFFFINIKSVNKIKWIFFYNLKTKIFIQIRYFKNFFVYVIFLQQFYIIFQKNFIYKSAIRFFGVGFFYLYYSVCILIIDASLTDDEPLWEPIEWSLVQTWILFLFIFAWIAENLITSRYGSYTGRDKRVWFAWYKTFWLIELYYILNFALVIIFVIIPFFFELNYNLSFLISWWQWYTKLFFFKFIFLYTVILLFSFILQLNVRWFFWKKSFFIVILINLFISYLLYIHFIMSFWGYFTNPIWYQQVRPIDYIQLSHEPARWGWGAAKKDHFTYHSVKTVFWFKNDNLYAASFLLIHLYFFLSLFFLYIYWIILFRRVYSMNEIPFTLLTYCISSLKQFFYLFLCIFFFIFFSYISHFIRFPLEYLWLINMKYWFIQFTCILYNYFFIFYEII